MVMVFSGGLPGSDEFGTLLEEDVKDVVGKIESGLGVEVEGGIDFESAEFLDFVVMFSDDNNDAFELVPF